MSARSLLVLLVTWSCGALAHADSPEAEPIPAPPAAVEASAPAAAPAAASATPPAMPPLRARLVRHGVAGKQPTTSLILDGGATLVVANRGDNTLTVFDAATMEPKATITDVGYSAWGMVSSGPTTLLVSNWAGATVAVVDRAAGKRIGEIPVGLKPSYLALSPDGSRLYSTGNFAGDITVADVHERRSLRTLETGRRPMGVAVSPDGRWLYVAACESNMVDKVDLKHEVVLEHHGAPLASTTNLVLTPDGARLLAAGDNDRLIVMDAATGKTDDVRVGKDPASVAVTPDGRLALVANYGEDTVSIVDLRAMEAIDVVQAGSGPIDVQTDGRRFYVCNDKAGTVSAFSFEPVAPVQIPPAVAPLPPAAPR